MVQVQSESLILCLIAGVRLPLDSFTDVKGAAALSFGRSKVDIYSCSWAIPSNGRTLGGPGRRTRKTLEKGTTEVNTALSVACE